MKVLVGLVVLTLVSLLLVACGGSEPSPEAAEEALITTTIEQIYDYINNEQWSGLWETYTSEWREQCSFVAMVNSLKDLRSQGIARLEVSRFEQIIISERTAWVSYAVEQFDDAGQPIGSYRYAITLVKQGHDWFALESCF